MLALVEIPIFLSDKSPQFVSIFILFLILTICDVIIFHIHAV